MYVSWLFLALLAQMSLAAGDISDIDYEIWDLMDGVVAHFGHGRTFYDVFGVDYDAPVSEVQRVYRRMSLQYHPDKNPGEDAEKKFQVGFIHTCH